MKFKANFYYQDKGPQEELISNLKIHRIPVAGEEYSFNSAFHIPRGKMKVIKVHTFLDGFCNKLESQTEEIYNIVLGPF